MKKNIILLGIQGSGKGTQSHLLEQNFGYQIFETGAHLRSLSQEQNEQGIMLKTIMDKGDLVPASIVIEILENFIKDLDPDVPLILDGIPRSEEQRILVDTILKNHNREFLVLEIKLSEDETFRRIQERAQKENRSDDTLETIKSRIENFKTQTLPVIDYYKSQNKLHQLQGEKSREEVHQDILHILNL